MLFAAVLEAKSVQSDPEAVRKARDFYTMCMNDSMLRYLFFITFKKTDFFAILKV